MLTEGTAEAEEELGGGGGDYAQTLNMPLIGLARS